MNRVLIAVAVIIAVGGAVLGLFVLGQPGECHDTPASAACAGYTGQAALRISVGVGAIALALLLVALARRPRASN